MSSQGIGERGKGGEQGSMRQWHLSLGNATTAL